MPNPSSPVTLPLEIDPLILDPENVDVLRTFLSDRVVISHLVQYKLQTLVDSGTVDCVIIDTEDGFSQLGGERHYLSAELGLQERNLVKDVLDGFPQALELECPTSGVLIARPPSSKACITETSRVPKSRRCSVSWPNTTK